ncbi:MAG TPA: DUF4402 domain-containing protein [Bacteroidales bacterium]|nr:DUF4402 domain-containing protein [Bacteroidales bacterium]
MKRLENLFFCLLLLLVVPVKLQSQNLSSATVTGHVTAEIIPVYTAAEIAQLNFGRFSPGPDGGEIIISPDGNLSVLGSIYKGTGIHNAAGFYVSGENYSSVTITLPDQPVVIQHVSGTRTMIVKDWNSNPGIGMGAGVLQNGSMTVYVGATLEVGSVEDNPVGIYAGTYSITFDFN